ncbi:MAG: LysR family transcriptional regulator, partial [Oscillospiraceae bacterium]|nr:LysR family transcriptional regulator [Oscillospiraceae bacterium]
MINETVARCFLILAETLSFTQTARQMYVTQQAVSKCIAKLEDDVGFVLFRRTHHYVRLTPAGEEYYAM